MEKFRKNNLNLMGLITIFIFLVVVVIIRNGFFGQGKEKGQEMTEDPSRMLSESKISENNLVSILDQTDPNKWMDHVAKRSEAPEVVNKLIKEIETASYLGLHVDQLSKVETTHWIQFDLAIGQPVFAQYNIKGNILDFHLSFQLKSNEDLLKNPRRKNHLFLKMGDNFPRVLEEFEASPAVEHFPVEPVKSRVEVNN